MALQAESRFEQDNRDIGELFAKLEQAGLEVTQFEFTHEEARIHTMRGIEQASAEKVEELAGLVADLIPTPVERVAFVDNGESTANSNLVVSRNDIQRNAIVDFLFDEIELEGFRLQSLDLAHESATFTISPDINSAELNRRVEVRAAHAMLAASTMPLDRVTIITTSDGIVYRRATFHREEVNRDAAIGELFDNAEADGFSIETVEISQEKATVYVAANNFKRADEYVNTAYKIANGIPFELEEMRLVDLAHHAGSTAVTLKKSEQGWSTVESASGASTPESSSNFQQIQADKTETAIELFEALAEHEFIAEGVQIKDDSVTIYVASRKFRQFARNVGRVARIATNVLPETVEELTIVYLSAGMEMNRITILRSVRHQNKWDC